MDEVLRKIKDISQKYRIENIILFGSRARGDNSSVSDYDIAVAGKDLTAVDKACFYADIEEIDTLKKIDIVFINENLTDDMIKNIKREGIVIYE